MIRPFPTGPAARRPGLTPARAPARGRSAPARAATGAPRGLTSLPRTRLLAGEAILQDPLPAHDVSALVARAVAGDRGAARTLTERILLPVLDVAVTRMLLGPRGLRFEKNDVVQEVFHHLYEDGWRRLRLYDPARGSLTNFVWAVADGWLHDHSRRHPPPEPTEDPEKDLPPDSGPEGKAALGEILDRIGRDLTTEELAVFQWVHFEGVSHAVVAARLGLDLEAAHKRVQRTDAKIRAIASGAEEQKARKRGPS